MTNSVIVIVAQHADMSGIAAVAMAPTIDEAREIARAMDPYAGCRISYWEAGQMFEGRSCKQVDG